MVSRRVSVNIDADLSGFNRGVLGASANTKKWVNDLESADSRLSAIVQTGLALAPALVPIGAAAVPAIAGLTTQLGFAAVAGGTALLAFQGVGDALGALNDYQLEPTAENLAKVEEKMAALGPAGEVFVRQLQDMRDEFQGLQDVAQAEMFPGMADGLESLMTQMPAFERVIGSVASAMGDLAADTGEGLAGPEWTEFFEYLESEAGPILEAMGHTLGNLVEGMTNMVMAFDPLSDSFTAGMLDMSEAFVRWSDNLDSSQGFQEFVRYVQESGPQAMETLGAIAGALIEFVEAAAPVGAVVLPVLEVLADALAGIADSPAGPVIVGAAAAIGTLGRSLALLKAVGLRGGEGESAMGKILGTETMKSYPAAARKVVDANNTLISAQAALATQATKTRDAQFAMIPTADKRKAVQDFAKANDDVRAASLAVADAEKQRTVAMRDSAVQMGKTAAAVGGLALMSTGAADGLGLTNTMSLAMMGTLAGPWGAAVGAGAGLLLDLEASANVAADAMANFDTAIAADNRTAALDSIAAMREELESLAGTDMASISFSSLSNMFSGTSVQDEIDALTSAIDEAEGEIAALDRAKAAAAGDKSYYNSLVAETEALEENINTMRAKRDEALRGSNAMLNYRSSLLDVSEAAAANTNVLGRNGQILKGQERAGIEAKQALNNMAGAWNGLNDKAQNAPGAFRGAIKSFVDAAEQMGIGRERAERMARAILEIPTKHDTKISMEVDTAMQKAAAIKAELASIDRNIDVYVNVRRPNADGYGAQVGSADGGSVPKTGKPYADRHHYLLADGEEVTSNRRGQADRFRPVLKAINADMPRDVIKGMLADGGTAGDKKKRRKTAFDNEGPQINVSAIRDMVSAAAAQADAAAAQVAAARTAERAALDQQEAAERNLSAAEDQLEATQQLRDSLASSVSSQFSGSLTGGGLAGLMGTLSQDINAGASMDATLQALVGAGLDTTGAAAGLFQELAASEDLETANQLLAAGPEMIAMLEQQYAQREQINTGRGNFAAGQSYGQLITMQQHNVAVYQAAADQANANAARMEGQLAIANNRLASMETALQTQADRLAEAMNSVVRPGRR